ncbi:uncharacterized protein [Pocillopora verrucosa]|uniref:uncharacterized protein n=1 Tax=Pocillopora verrucosa TaxID=203993 RepID=UPI003341A1FC
MAAILNFMSSWLESGYNLAAKYSKWIWAETKAIFRMAMDALKSISNRIRAYFSYSRERSWIEENGCRVERGRDRLEVGVGVGVSSEESSPQGLYLPSDPEKREEARRKLKEESKENRKLCERLGNYFGKVESLMNEDEQHNQPETDEKLRQFNQEKETQELREMLEGSLMVNLSLA